MILHVILLQTDSLMFFIQETVDVLEENIREMKIQLKIQIKKSEELEMLKKSMTKELIFYRQVHCCNCIAFLLLMWKEKLLLLISGNVLHCTWLGLCVRWHIYSLFHIFISIFYISFIVLQRECRGSSQAR